MPSWVVTALSGFVWTRRWRYGPFFLLLALLAVVVTMAGFPDGTPLRHGLYFTYNHVSAPNSRTCADVRRIRAAARS